MAATLKTRQIQARVFLEILNKPLFRRLLNVISNEYIAEFDIKNNSLVVKIFDKNKLEGLKKGRLKKPSKSLLERQALQKKFPTGRFNSLSLSIVIANINNDKFILGRMGFASTDVIQTITMLGTNSIIANGFDKEELKRMREAQQNQSLRARYGVRVMQSRGNR